MSDHDKVSTGETAPNVRDNPSPNSEQTNFPTMEACYRHLERIAEIERDRAIALATIRMERELGLARLRLQAVEELRQICKSNVIEYIRSESPDLNRIGQSLSGKRAELTKRLNKVDLKVVWFDLFGTKLDNDCSGIGLEEGVIELLDRASKEKLESKLVELLLKRCPNLRTVLLS